MKLHAGVLFGWETRGEVKKAWRWKWRYRGRLACREVVVVLEEHMGLYCIRKFELTKQSTYHATEAEVET